MSNRTGRDPRGRFLPGCAPGPGNPHAAAVAQFRSTVLESVTEDDIRAVVGKLVSEAKDGSPWAVRELLNRVVGTPERCGADGIPLDALQVSVVYGGDESIRIIEYPSEPEEDITTATVNKA